jgi:hypothetical protein
MAHIGRERLRVHFQHGEFPNLLTSEEARERFSGVWRAPIRPLPVTFPAFLAWLAEGTADARGLGYRAATGGVALDAERRLPGLLPDLSEIRPVALLRTERWQPSG